MKPPSTNSNGIASAWRWRFADQLTVSGDWDLTTKTIYHSPRLRSLLGHAAEAAILTEGEYPDDVHPEDRDKGIQAMRNHIKLGTDYDMALRFVCADGGYRWFRTRGVAQRNDGRAVRMAGSITDITDLVEARGPRGMPPIARNRTSWPI